MGVTRQCEACIMHWLKIVFLLALTASVSPGNAHQHEKLMDEIEQAVVLPRGAKPRNAYGQNYAFLGDHQVIAVYFIPEALLEHNANCVHGDMKPCTKDEMQELLNENAVRRAASASAGERRWFANKSDLPSIADGGCNQIMIRYDIPTKQVLSVGCNGR